MSFLDDFAMMLGRAPKRRKPRTDAAEIFHGRKRGGGNRIRRILEELAARPPVHTWRNRRWATLIGINLLFTLSYWLDVQLVEGSLTASRFLGFHMADTYSSLLVALAQHHAPINLVIGAVTVLLLWVLVGGRAYCSWVCPYHLVAEWGDMLHVKLARRGIVFDHPFHRGVRGVLWLLFAFLALVSGQTLFLTLNPIGILSRTMVYGPTLALLWVVLLLAFEILYTRRAWCRYLCPIGLTYGIVGAITPIGVEYKLEACAHEGECRSVCEVPHVLDITIKGRAEDSHINVGPDCTRCGLCVDACPTNSLDFKIKGLSSLL
ncbi:MAG: NapH/MauN family ferredoxin-type protein [bacterium]|nr:NapH/MauN family ferredoxin-type protein [bacterium]